MNAREWILPDGEQYYSTRIPAERANLCLDCECVSPINPDSRLCPCGSSAVTLLSGIINRSTSPQVPNLETVNDVSQSTLGQTEDASRGTFPTDALDDQQNASCDIVERAGLTSASTPGPRTKPEPHLSDGGRG